MIASFDRRLKASSTRHRRRPRRASSRVPSPPASGETPTSGHDPVGRREPCRATGGVGFCHRRLPIGPGKRHQATGSWPQAACGQHAVEPKQISRRSRRCTTSSVSLLLMVVSSVKPELTGMCPRAGRAVGARGLCGKLRMPGGSRLVPPVPCTRAVPKASFSVPGHRIPRQDAECRIGRSRYRQASSRSGFPAQRSFFAVASGAPLHRLRHARCHWIFQKHWRARFRRVCARSGSFDGTETDACHPPFSSMNRLQRRQDRVRRPACGCPRAGTTAAQQAPQCRMIRRIPEAWTGTTARPARG